MLGVSGQSPEAVASLSWLSGSGRLHGYSGADARPQGLQRNGCPSQLWGWLDGLQPRPCASSQPASGWQCWPSYLPVAGLCLRPPLSRPHWPSPSDGAFCPHLV